MKIILNKNKLIKFIDNEKNTVVIKNFEKVNIGTMPIMVKSQLCILNNLDESRLTELGECPYDQGGYFIIKGKEKIFLSQEKKVCYPFHYIKNLICLYLCIPGYHEQFLNNLNIFQGYIKMEVLLRI